MRQTSPVMIREIENQALVPFNIQLLRWFQCVFYIGLWFLITSPTLLVCATYCIDVRAAATYVLTGMADSFPHRVEMSLVDYRKFIQINNQVIVSYDLERYPLPIT
jgi:hypothetical protein